MSSASLFLFNFLLNALWQIPLVFCAACLAARLTRRNGPQWEHRIWITALPLELLLPFGQLNFKPIAAWFLALFAPATPNAAHASVLVSTGPAIAAASAWNLPPLLILLVLATWAATILYFAARLLWRLQRTSTLRRNSHTIDASEYPILHNFLSAQPAPVQLLVSPSVSGPAIIGFLRPALLLPPHFLDQAEAPDIEAALAHEATHLRRRDYAKNLLYEILSLPIAWHPVVWLTRTRIAESREILCDHQAAHLTHGPQAYARALLRLASRQSARTPQPIHAIGIFDTQSLERRIMQLTQLPIRTTLTRRLLTLAACAALAFATGASALALHVDAASAPGHQSKNAKSDKTAGNSASVPAGVIAGNRISGENPKYPVMAKKAKIQGEVVLHAVISKHGNIESLHVVSGPAMLRNSALNAVRTWRYKPYIQNGHAVAVDTTINVIYHLDGGSPVNAWNTTAIQQQLTQAEAQLAAATAKLNNPQFNRAEVQKQMAEAQQKLQNALAALKKQGTTPSLTIQNKKP